MEVGGEIRRLPASIETLALSRLSLKILANMSTESQPTDFGCEINVKSANVVTKSWSTYDIGRHVDRVSADSVF